MPGSNWPCASSCRSTWHSACRYMPINARRGIMLAVRWCPSCTKTTDALRLFLCGTCVSSRARSECAIYCHRTNPLYCKIPQTTARTWCGDAWQGLRVVLCLEAYPVYKHRHNICHGMVVDSRMGAYTASRHGPPGGPKTRPTEWARKVNHHLGPTQWSRTVHPESVGPK